jgi:lipopolysaccharide biosynthesis glycosyltransferase
MSDRPIHIASATDARYVPHLATLIESFAASNSLDGITLHLLHDDSVTPDVRDRLRTSSDRHGLSVEFVDPAARSSNDMPPAADVPPVIWYRIWLPELLARLDRVLYLDADTLVLQDLHALWRCDVNDGLLAAVAQPREMGGAARLTALGHAPLPAYFNSGVLLMNLARMRAERLSQRLAELGRALAEDMKHPGWVSAEFPYPDQDAYNLACDGRWQELHPRWNCFGSLFLPGPVEACVDESVEFAEAVASPAILHFEGSIFAKPWNYRCVHPHRNLYREYRRRSPWPLAELEGSGLKERILDLLPVRQQVALGRLKRRVAARASTV